VKLSDLMRQGRPYVTITKEFAVNKELGDGALGSIQLLIRNMGRVPGV